MRNRRILTGHKVGSTNSAERNGIIVGAEIANNTDRARIGKDSEILICLDSVLLRSPRGR